MRADAAMDAMLRSFLVLGRRVKRTIVIAMDASLCVLSALLAFSLRLGEFHDLPDAARYYLVVALACWFPVFWLSGVYRSIFRFVGFRTILMLIRAACFVALPLMIWFTLVGQTDVPRTIPMIHLLLFVTTLCLSRIVARYLLVDLLTRRQHHGILNRVLVYGAGTSGRQLAVNIQYEPRIHFCGFVDDDARLAGQRLDGYEVFDSAILPELVARAEVSSVVLAMPNISRDARRRIIHALQPLSVQVQTLPNVQQIVEGRVSIDDLREIQIDDLLGRDVVPPNALLLGRVAFGKRILVTGAGGSIGGELCRQLITLKPACLLLIDQSEFALYQIERELRALAGEYGAQTRIVGLLCDAGDRATLRNLMSVERPDVIFHAAAYKHVPIVEECPLAGIRNNIFGTLAVAEEAERAGVERFILVSTDKAVRPTNVMGATKRVAEQILQAKAAQAGPTKFAMVRFGNVLGSSGSVVPLFRSQIERGGPVTLTDRRVTRFFMTIPEAAQLVIQAGAMAKGGDVFVLDMGAEVKIFDLAQSMIRLSGLTIRDEDHPDGDIEIIEVGLRPGEKLYEELLIGNDPKPTRHERIMQAREDFVAWPELSAVLDEMASAIRDYRIADARRGLYHLVPEYISADTADVA